MKNYILDTNVLLHDPNSILSFQDNSVIIPIEVLEEIGVSTEGVRSKHVSELLDKLTFDYVIVVCDSANESCPRTSPGILNRLFWPFDDPPAFQGTESQRPHKFRSVRDEIRARITQWVAQ